MKRTLSRSRSFQGAHTWDVLKVFCGMCELLLRADKQLVGAFGLGDIIHQEDAGMLLFIPLVA